jgi:hypothetical protein
MKSALHKTIAALILLTGIAVPQVCGARTSGSRSTASGPTVFAQKVDGTAVAGSTVPLFECGTAATIWTGDISNSSSAIPLGLAMADFTGDSHPDLATIKLDRFGSSDAQYVIEIQLTEGGHQSLRLTAPARDLVITPQDVTGDGTLDLVVRAVGSRSPIAVFLNDGCGHFSAKEPTRFAQSLQDLPGGPEFTAQQASFGVAVAATGPYTAECQHSSRRPLHEKRGSLLFGNDGTPSRLLSSFGSNRAPPALA